MAATVEAAVPERHNSDKLSSEATSDQRRSLLSHLEDDEDKTVYAIMMPESYQMKQGVQLWQGVHLGKFLGAGMQAQVFQLARADGTPIGKVIKINHGDIGSKILNNNVLWIGMDREWEIGTQLRAALQEANGQVPGFMKVCDCLVRRRGNCAAFSGMLMEELHGWEVYKRIDTPEFHNIHYVREMLFQVFSALDRAQRKLGFQHADLGMRNIMEHYPRTWEEMPGGAAARAALPVRPGFTSNADGSRLPLGPDVEFKIIDYGVSKFSKKIAQAAGGRAALDSMAEAQSIFGHGRRLLFSTERKKATTTIEMENPSDDSSSDGERGWLARRLGGKRHPAPQFKVRMACFSPGKKVPRGKQGSSSTGSVAPGRPSPSRFSESDDDEEIWRPERFAATQRAQQEQQLAQSQQHDQSVRQQVAPAALPSRQDSSGRGSSSRGGSGSLTTGNGSPSVPHLQAAAGVAGNTQSSGSTQQLGDSDCGSQGQPCDCATLFTTTQLMQGMGHKKQSPIEAMYRHFWHRKGDVFHLLLGMALALDDRVWPVEDADEVLALVSLIHHVTGIRLKAQFAHPGEAVQQNWRQRLHSPFGKRRVASVEPGAPARDFGRRGNWRRWFKRWYYRIKGHTLPYNSGLLAGEALVHPFFTHGARGVNHAAVPAQLRQMFPAGAGEAAGGQPAVAVHV